MHYINNNTNCEVIVTGTERTNATRGNLLINDFNKIEDLDKVLRIIDKMENEIKADDSREIKFINQQIISFCPFVNAVSIMSCREEKTCAPDLLSFGPGGHISHGPCFFTKVFKGDFCAPIASHQALI